MNMDGPGGRSTMDSDKALGGSLGHRPQCDLGLQHRLWASAWTLMVTQVTDINTNPGYSRIMDPDKALSGSMDQ